MAESTAVECSGDNCRICSLKVADNGIMCELCEGWIHYKCAGLATAAHKILQNEGIHYYCKFCNKGMKKIIEFLSEAKEKQEKIEKEVDQLKMYNEKMCNEQKVMREDIKKLHEDLEKFIKEGNTKLEVEQLTRAFIEDGSWSNLVKSEITNRMNSVKEDIACVQKEVANAKKELESSWADVVKNEISVKIGVVNNQIADVHKEMEDTKTQLNNDLEREKRKNNIIIFNVEESGSCENFSDQQNRDMNEVCKMLSTIIGENMERSEVKRILRLGKRNYHDKEHIPQRPLLVEFVSGMTKNYVMQHLYRLRNADGYQNIVMSHDMTVSEREECKRLVDVAKDMQSKEESGEFIFRVRGLPGKMKVVKIRKHQS